MIITVTGASGYIGSNLINTLIQQGHEVRVIVRNIKEVPAEIVNKKEITYYAGDITMPNTINAPLKNCDQLYHLAAYASAWAPNHEIFYDVNVQGTKNIMQAAMNAGVQKVVYTSTAGVYGPQKNGELINEKQDYNLDAFTHYEKSKIQAELYIKQEVTKHLDVSIVNPTRVYGPGSIGVSNAATVLMKKYLENNWHLIPGNGTNIGNYVYVNDVVQGHLLAMEKGKNGENYLLTGANLTYDEFFDLIKEISGVDVTMFHVTDFWAELISSGISLYSLFSYSKDKIKPEWVKRYLKNWGIDGSKAINELGYQPTDVKKGFKETINWLNENVISEKTKNG